MEKIAGFPSGTEVFWLIDRLASLPAAHTERDPHTPLPTWIHVAETDDACAHTQALFATLAPQVPSVHLPSLGALDTTLPLPLESLLPYGEAFAPHTAHPLSVTAQLIVCTPSVLRRSLGQALIKPRCLTVSVGLTYDKLLTALPSLGYRRTDVAHRPGDYAVRGSLIDIFPPQGQPKRIDFFGDDIDTITSFDPLSQRRTDACNAFTLAPAHPFCGAEDKDPHAHDNPACKDHLTSLIAAIDHSVPADLVRMWPLVDTPLLWPRHLPVLGLSLASPQCLDAPLTDETRYAASALLAALPGQLSLADLWYDGPLETLVTNAPTYCLTPHAALMKVRLLPPLGFKTTMRTQEALDTLLTHSQTKRLLLTAHTDQGCARWATFLKAHNQAFQRVSSWETFCALSRKKWGLLQTPLTHNLTGDDWCLITEKGFWPTPLKKTRKAKRGDLVLSDFAALHTGDYVTHENHGIGRYEGLETLTVNGVSHDCLKLSYAEGDRLFVPVENMRAVMRYGAEASHPPLDRLGSHVWHNRKARAAKKAAEVAEYLLTTAAQRSLCTTKGLSLDDPTPLQRFEEGFPFLATQDQQQAIDDTLKDLARPVPMDRLVCGDVGFGKTEVALRAAFMAASSGMQVAVVVPTTLLARQHARNFERRFAQTGFSVGQLSRLVSPREAARVKKELAEGRLDIVVATHALLSDTVTFRRLGLLIIDEEQHFGVAHKEKLKTLKANLHVLTLTATPIPRTLNMALSDIKSLSLITTPPADRKAVQTTVATFAPKMLKEILSHEKKRDGQSFVICPRIAHIQKLAALIQDFDPPLRLGIAHGELSRSALESVMKDFEDGAFDILLSTNIVESGIDIERVNTLAIYRADLFGLANLYQLRGRVGRGKTQGLAYLFLDEHKQTTPTAQKRLEIMQSLDYLGAGFAVASHDMDIRGTGNLVGEEQSGHIREVGVSYYQKLLCDAIAALKKDDAPHDRQPPAKEEPKVSFPRSVLLPPSYVASLDVRLGLYGRLAGLEGLDEVDDMGEEWRDRFGPVPEEARNLLVVTKLKIAARRAWVTKVEMGQESTALSFLSPFPYPERLLGWIRTGPFMGKLTSDQRWVLPIHGDLDRHIHDLHRLLAHIAGFGAAS
ncbi:transcription-repair coupling factor [Candidatus Hepatobacter penaei]|uniref:transcription-repair coupling factor n=1 Tax=Candidatus Hepatobacter penaei TaxID=1274402 RepID=UPI00155A8BA5|nr:DEAD/DEAH box helicase [Candidatus Hepatobacter penaei]